METVADADGFDHALVPLGVGLAPRERERQEHVLAGGPAVG